MDKHEPLIAPCGIDCAECEIRLAATNVQLAMDIVEWHKHETKNDITHEKIRCGGCSGAKEHHWSMDCWILKCCVEVKGLAYCSECPDFPCAKLEEWAKGNDGNTKGLERLKGMKR